MLKLGRRLELKGIVGSKKVGVDSLRLWPLDLEALPEARRMSAARVGRRKCSIGERIETEGFVRVARDEVDRIALELSDGGSPVSVRVKEPLEAVTLEELIGTRLRIRGTCGFSSEISLQENSHQLYAPSWDHVDMLQMASEVPVRSIASVKSSRTSFQKGEAIRVRGVVEEQRAGAVLRVRDSTGKCIW